MLHFFFNDTSTTEIYTYLHTLSLHDALPILAMTAEKTVYEQRGLAIKILVYTSVMCIIISLAGGYIIGFFGVTINSFRVAGGLVLLGIDRKSTRLNSSH